MSAKNKDNDLLAELKRVEKRVEELEKSEHINPLFNSLEFC